MTLIERDRARDIFLFKTFNLYTIKQTHFRQSLDPARTSRRTHWSGGEREKNREDARRETEGERDGGARRIGRKQKELIAKKYV